MSDPQGLAGQAAAPPLISSRPVDMRLVVWMLGLTAIWGLNAVSIKVVTRGIAPVMAASLRGGLALVCITLYAWWRGESLRFNRAQMLQGALAGLIIGAEGVALYHGARFTNGGHISIFINTAPFFVAGGAHFLLPGEKMHGVRWAGLVLAFAGVVTLFSDQLFIQRSGFWRGDLLVILAACFWASSTLYIRGFLGSRFSALRLMFLRILVSTPLLLAASLLSEPNPFPAAGLAEWGSVLFQGVVVVFFSYMVWVMLLQRYPATALQPFVFLGPFWGVGGGAVLLDEPLSAMLIGSLVLVAGGLFLVNRPTPQAGQPRTAEPS